MTMKKPIEKAMFSQSTQPGNSAFFRDSPRASASASIACSVEKFKAFMPRAMDCPSTPHPLMTGFAQNLLRSDSFWELFSQVTISPSGLRTATQ